MMRRRRYQGDAGCGVADPGDVLADFMSRQLAALAGLGTLRDLDLQLIGMDQIVCCHTEPAEATCLIRERLLSPLGMGW